MKDLSMNNIAVFVINLNKDIEKRQYMEMLCRQYELNCNFITAIDGKKLRGKDKEKIYDPVAALNSSDRELLDGEIGCAMSHKIIYEEIIQKKISHALIFEDDVVLDDKITEILQFLHTFPQEWELVLLGHHSSTSRSKISTISMYGQKNICHHYRLVRFSEMAHGAYGYLINYNGAKKLLEQLKTIDRPVDHLTGTDDFINLYAIIPPIIGISKQFDKMSNLAEARSRTSLLQKQQKFVEYLKKSVLSKPLKQMKTCLRRLWLTIKPIRKYEIDSND